MKVKHLQKSEKKALGLDKKDTVELIDGKFLRVNGELRYFYLDKIPIPTLKYLQKNDGNLKRIIVDMGSIKFLTGGADLMRPGITEIPKEIEKGEIVTVVDENNKKPIMVGEALLNSSDMQVQETGKSVKNHHYVGDEIWNK